MLILSRLSCNVTSVFLIAIVQCSNNNQRTPMRCAFIMKCLLITFFLNIPAGRAFFSYCASRGGNASTRLVLMDKASSMSLTKCSRGNRPWAWGGSWRRLRRCSSNGMLLPIPRDGTVDPWSWQLPVPLLASVVVTGVGIGIRFDCRNVRSCSESNVISPLLALLDGAAMALLVLSWLGDMIWDMSDEWRATYGNYELTDISFTTTWISVNFGGADGRHQL